MSEPIRLERNSKYENKFSAHEKRQNIRGDFEELNFEEESKYWFENLLRIAI